MDEGLLRWVFNQELRMQMDEMRRAGSPPQPNAPAHAVEWALSHWTVWPGGAMVIYWDSMYWPMPGIFASISEVRLHIRSRQDIIAIFGPNHERFARDTKINMLSKMVLEGAGGLPL